MINSKLQVNYSESKNITTVKVDNVYINISRKFNGESTLIDKLYSVIKYELDKEMA